ncbi:hypothetical protein OEA41_009882 [Lepraria neglecta]|uniref:Apple domain-containing protein n=1 Tax=Lepraria neglecta TaxID=209136 RepID=A0AAD9YXZ4_9LECA|nr:hypothetical protein OEA41_009882 [Lepraria neglecta]
MYTPLTILALTPIIATALTNYSLEPICQGINTEDHACIRYVDFDVTGVVTEVDLNFPKIQNKCDCIKSCLDRPTTCAAWVYKFSTAASVAEGHRTCTLYSQFNLPSGVEIEIDVDSGKNKNINAKELVALGNNPQAGSLVPEAFKDKNLNTTADDKAYSG